jgi:asparagine synthase (glutamine-hydrolysing)
VRPLFARVDADGARIATRLDDLTPSDRPDLGYVQDYLRFQTPNTARTFCEGTFLIRNGERWTFMPGRESQVDRLPLPSPAGRDIGQALEAAVSAAGAHAHFHLSSGLDSTLLVLLAKRLFGSVRAASFVTRGAGASSELESVRRLAHDSGIELSIYDFSSIDLWAEGADLVRHCLPYPAAHPSHLARYLLDKCMARDGAKMVVSGRGPDELLGGYPWHRAEFASPEAHLKRITCTPEEWITRLFRELCPSESRERHASLVEGTTLSLANRLLFDLGGIFESWNVIDAGLQDGLGITCANPFLAPEVASYLFARPDDEKVLGAAQKVYLRRCFADVYPDYILSTPKAGLTLDIREYLRLESVDSIVRRLYHDSRFGERYLRLDGVTALVEETMSGGANHGWQIWSLYLCGLAFDKWWPEGPAR